jgi:hypothetical protein
MEPYSFGSALFRDDLSVFDYIFKGKKQRTIEEAKEHARYECNRWSSYQYEYNQSLKIITLARCSDNQMVYLTPDQAELVIIGKKMKDAEITGNESLKTLI